MWWPCFLLGAAFAGAASININNSSEAATLDDLSGNHDLEILKRKLDEMTSNYLEYFADAHSQQLKRGKRQVSSREKSDLLVDKTGAYRLQALKPILNMCSPALKIKFVDILNDTYGLCISARTVDTPATVHLGFVTNFAWLELHSWTVSNPVDAALLDDNGVLNIVVADSNHEKGIDLIIYDIATQNVTHNHIIHGMYPTAVAIWKMKTDGTYHMAMANFFGDRDSDDLTMQIYTYNWFGTYFDQYSEVIGYDVKDIEPFHIHGAAYLAVANFRRGKENYKVDSEIFKYSWDSKKWLSHQKIRTHQAMDIEFFTLGQGAGQEFFLAVANYARSNERNVSSVIYKFVKDIFVPFQCLETYGATSIAAVTEGHKFLLAIANEDILHLYQYDGWRFVQASVQSTQKFSFGVNDLSFHHILGDSKTLVLAISNSDSRYMHEPSVFEVVFVHEKSLEKWYDESSEWCQKKLDDISNPTVTGLEDLQNVFFVDQTEPIVIHGDLDFTAGLEVSKVTTPQFVDSAKGVIYDSSVLLKLKDLNARLRKASERIMRIEEVFNNALKLEGQQKVTANYEFHDVTFQCETQTCVFTNITTTMLNGEDISNLKENLIFLDENQVIDASLSAQNVNANVIFVDGLVDGISMLSVVTKSGNHNITSHKTFRKTLHATELEVGGLVDEVRISPQTVLLRTGYQNITGNLTFTNLNTQWLEITGLVNGQDLNTFYQDVILTDSNYVITGEKTFQDLSLENLQLAPGSKINGIDIVDLYHNAFWKNGGQEITAPMTFSNVTFKKNVFCDDVNGIKFPGPQIILVDESAEITAPQIFLDSTFISQLHIGNSINGIAVDKSTGELDILLKNGHQVVTGHKTFETIVLAGNSFVGGTVDGVDLTDFYASSIRRDTSVNSQHTWNFNNLTVEGPIRIEGSISGVNITEIYQNAVKLDETNLSNFIFEGLVHIENLENHDINGIDVSEDFVQVNKKQVITGKKTFEKVILQADSTVHGLVNNIDLNFLSDTLLKVGNQHIKSKKIFNGDVAIGKLTVHGKINGVNFDDLVTLHGDQVITGTKTFSSLKANSIQVNDMEVSGFVNNIDINKMVKDTLLYDGSQNVSGTKTIKGILRIANSSNLQTNSLNGIDISNLWADAVLVDVPQTISGHKTFATPVSFEKLWVEGSIDNVTRAMMNDWMLQGVDQTITGNLRFLDDLTANDVFVNGLINGINITLLNQTIVKTNEPSFIEGPVIFGGIVYSAGNITLSGTVGGIDLSEEVVLTTQENVITGLKTFEGDIVVQGNLFVELIDNVSIKDMCENTILLDREGDLQGLVVDGDVTFENGATVDGYVAGVNITSLNLAAVKSEDSETHVSGQKTFDALTVEGNLIVKGKFGGIDIKDLFDNYMSTSLDQEIKVTHNFEELNVKGSMYATNFYTSDQKVNGIDLKKLNDTVLRTTGFQEISANYSFDEVVFDDDVIVVGKVNGLEIPKGVMKRNRTNYINSPKIFEQSIRVLGDLHMDSGKKIQDVDLSDWSTRVVKKNYGIYRIGGFKTFMNVTAQDMIVQGSIGGVKVSKDTLLLSYDDQTITGRKIIAGNVDIIGDLTISGLINNVNLIDLANRAVLKDRNNTITALKTFKRPLTIHSLQATSVNGVNILDLQKRIDDHLNFDDLVDKFLDLEVAIQEMKMAVARQAVILQYYELFQSFATSTGYTFLYVPTADAEYLFLSDFAESSSGCTRIRVYEYNEDKGNFELSDQELISSKAIAMRTIQIWNSTFVITANADAKPRCFGSNAMIDTDDYDDDGDTKINIYYYLVESGSFVPYQSLMAQSAEDVVAFESDSALCFVYLEMMASKVYCAFDAHHPFEYIETLRTRGGRRATIITYNTLTMLAIASVDDSKEQSVDIYYWNIGASTFEEPIQVIRSTQAESVMFMKRTDLHSTEVFLVIAEGTIPRINNVPRLFIYKYHQSLRSFFKYQEIKDSGQLDWTTLPTGELMFFVLDEVTRQIKYYRYKGAAGFVLSDSITSVGVQTLHAFKRNSPKDKMNHYLALAGVKNTALQVWSDPYSAMILKSKMQGERIPAPPPY